MALAVSALYEALIPERRGVSMAWRAHHVIK